MNTLKDFVLITVDPDEKSTSKVGNTDLIIPTNFREYEEDICVQSGIVKAIPLKTSTGDKVNIKEGDKVYAHHFLTHEDNRADQLLENTYAMDYKEIYCKVMDGEIEMLTKWNLLQPVEEQVTDENGIVININGALKEGLAIMRHPSENMKSKGIINGTVVEFKRNAGYLIMVEGIKYYRIADEHILMHYGKK